MRQDILVAQPAPSDRGRNGRLDVSRGRGVKMPQQLTLEETQEEALCDGPAHAMGPPAYTQFKSAYVQCSDSQIQSHALTWPTTLWNLNRSADAIGPARRNKAVFFKLQHKVLQQSPLSSQVPRAYSLCLNSLYATSPHSRAVRRGTLSSQRSLDIEPAPRWSTRVTTHQHCTGKL